ncbi:MAG: selenium cofactor biosynthesis protein YqeC [Desulfobacterales bacterium]|jgi:probable selenium-dependent hydroxylase accessory protein YqeC
MTSLQKAFMMENGGVVSLVGSGGKTTLMFHLAREFASAGDSVLTTTTTKICRPSQHQSACVVTAGAKEPLFTQLDDLRNEHLHITVAAGHVAGHKKLIGLNPDVISAIHQANLFRWIIVEADGSRRRPLKAPADHEPVIPDCTKWIIGVLGLSGVGKPLTEEWVYRHELFAQVTRLSPGDHVTEEAVCEVLTSEKGIFKDAPVDAIRLVFLNQADMRQKRVAGQKIVEYLARRHTGNLRRVVVGCAGHDPAVLDWLDMNSKNGIV